MTGEISLQSPNGDSQNEKNVKVSLPVTLNDSTTTENVTRKLI